MEMMYKAISQRLEELDRPLSAEDNSYIGSYADCILHIEVYKCVTVKMSKMYYGEFILVQSAYPLAIFKTIIDSDYGLARIMNEMYSKIGNLIEDYNNKGELSN